MLNRSIVRQIRQVARNWQTDLALPFASVLPTTTVVMAAALEKSSFRERFFPPGGHVMGLSGAGAERGRFLPRSGQPCNRLLRPAEKEDPFAPHRRVLQSQAAFERRAAQPPAEAKRQRT